jgi:hypothetical protein
VQRPEGLSENALNLWDALNSGRELAPPHQILVLNICRIADRLDDLAEELAGRPLVVINHQGTETPNPLLTEHRMQLATMSQLLTRMGFKELPKAGEKVSVADRMAEQRAKREARKAAGA